MYRAPFVIFILIGLWYAPAQGGDQYSGLSLQVSRFGVNGSGALNDVLTGKQAGTIPAVRYAYGFSLITQRHGRVTSSYDLSLEGGISRWNKGAKFSSRINLLHFFYSLSYTLLESDRLGFYPLLGLGLQQTSLEIKKRNLKKTSLDNVLNGQAMDINIMAMHLSLKLALRGEFIVREHHAEGVTTKIPIGFELAYIQPFYTLIDNSLSGNGFSYVKVTDMPQLAWSGIKLSLSIGLRALIKGDR